MEIPGVPQSIAREQYRSLIAALGLDANQLRSLEFLMDGVYAEVFGEHPGGPTLIDPEREDAVVHRVWIPIR